VASPSAWPGGGVLTAQDTAVACARACDEIKAEDIQVLDLRRLTQFTDYFVLCTGASERQLRALAENVRLTLREQGVERFGEEGTPPSGWILLDYIDVIVHVFRPDSRAFYQLEMLWGDADRVDWRPPAPPAS
jgi:ribosome-associated protein